MIKLIGVLVVAAGFALRFNTLLVVLAAGIVTGLVAGMSFHEIMGALGRFFVDNRYMTLPVVLMAPVVGLLEQYGLRERAAALIRRAGGASAGRVFLAYHAVRGATSTVGLNIGNHASMVRPLVAPMGEAAAAVRVAEGEGNAGPPRADVAPREVGGEVRAAASFECNSSQIGGHRDVPAHLPAGRRRRKFTVSVELPAPVTERIRAHAAAAENLGNFFADDILVAIGPVLLIKGFYDSVGVDAGIWAIALWGAPTAVFVLGVGWWRYRALDRWVASESRGPDGGSNVG